MSNGSIRSISNQTVEALRAGMLEGRWLDTLPGRGRLAVELGVSDQTIEAAIRRLEKEGMLMSQGPGKRRRIILPEGKALPRNLLVRILAYDPADRGLGVFIDLIEKLSKAGFNADFAPKSMLDLGMDLKRVARLVRQNPADVWIVVAGPRDVLEWFSKQPMPIYAYFGHSSSLPIAGCMSHRDFHTQIRRLIALGHRNIVTLVREDHIKPEPSLFARNFLQALSDAGIEPSPYNLPAWGYQPEGLRRCLESIFKLTPPTALFIAEDTILLAVRDYLAKRGMIVPRDVSLICHMQHSSYSWCDPPLAHFDVDFYSINRRVVRWVKRVAHGKADRRQIVIPAKFIEGGTIGPAPSATNQFK